MIARETELDSSGNNNSDPGEIQSLHQLIAIADDSMSARMELLFGLGFITGHKTLYKKSARILNFLDQYLTPIVLLAIVLALLSAIFNITQLSIAASLVAGLSAYFSWVRSERSKNVDDAFRRKDMANAMIVANGDLLLPYTGNVFDFDAKYAEQHLSAAERMRVDMYVFAEMDNLEFVFEKSRARLIEDRYVVRAIKIFLARVENDGFYNVAKRLINVGRYNEDFVQTTTKLLEVAHSRFESLATSI